jgi:hypothetical protein
VHIREHLAMCGMRDSEKDYQVTKLANIAAFGATTALIYELRNPVHTFFS